MYSNLVHIGTVLNTLLPWWWRYTNNTHTHWPMAVSRCMVECLSFYAFSLILYSQGSIATALFLNSESGSWSHDSWFECQQTKKQYNTRTMHFTEIVYLKQRQKDMLNLVFRKENLCPFFSRPLGVSTHLPLPTQLNIYQVYVNIVGVMRTQACTW